MPNLRTIAAVLASCLAAAGSMAHAQARGQAEVLPIWNRASGQVEAFLVLEPLHGAAASKPFSRAALNASFGTASASQLGLVCGQENGLGSIGSLVGNCLVAAVDERGRAGTAGASVRRNEIRLGVGVTERSQSLPTWLVPGTAGSRVSSNALTVVGERAVGREATVSVGGTLARARLMLPSSSAVQDRWDVRSLSVGTRVGAFSANVVGRVIDAPSSRWREVDLGFTWQTPWRGQLSVGAENVVTRGRNPFARSGSRDDEGTVPYVRYQQDL